MTQEAFIAFVQSQGFLGKERQDDLIQNAGWIIASERDLLAKEIEQAGRSIEENNKKIIEELDHIEQAVRQFQHEELPKLAKAEETSEHESEQEKAEKLLQDL